MWDITTAYLVLHTLLPKKPHHIAPIYWWFYKIDNSVALHRLPWKLLVSENFESWWLLQKIKPDKSPFVFLLHTTWCPKLSFQVWHNYLNTDCFPKLWHWPPEGWNWLALRNKWFPSLKIRKISVQSGYNPWAVLSFGESQSILEFSCIGKLWGLVQVNIGLILTREGSQRVFVDKENNLLAYFSQSAVVLQEQSSKKSIFQMLLACTPCF